MSESRLPVRSTDPATSYMAAFEATMRGSKIRPLVLEILTEKGPMTHDALIGAYNMRCVTDPDTPPSSESGLRTRLNELVQAGLARPTEQLGLSRFGRRSIMWEAVEPEVYVDPRSKVAQMYLSDENGVDLDLDDLPELKAA